MSEARDPKVIQQEYGQVCAQLGEKQFQIKVLEAESQQLLNRIFSLGKEMQEAQKSTPAETQPIQSVSEATNAADPTVSSAA